MSIKVNIVGQVEGHFLMYSKRSQALVSLLDQERGDLDDQDHERTQNDRGV